METKDNSPGPMKVSRQECQSPSSSEKDSIVTFTYDDIKREVLGVVEVVLAADEDGRKISTGGYGSRVTLEPGMDMREVRCRIRNHLADVVGEAIRSGNAADEARAH